MLEKKIIKVNCNAEAFVINDDICIAYYAGYINIGELIDGIWRIGVSITQDEVQDMIDALSKLEFETHDAYVRI